MSSSFNVPSKIVIGDDELLKITSNINLSTNIKNFSSRIKIIKKNINESLQETQRYEYTYQFVNTKNEEFFKKYSQDFFVVQPEIGIVVRYEFLPFIEFFRYVKKDTTFEIHDKQNSSLINLSLKTKPFWQNNNILEIDRFSSTELYLRFQRYIYSIKGSNTPYTESFEETYFSNQEFKYDKELHNKIKDDLENIYFSTLVVVQQKDTQKEMLKRINDSYRNEGNQLIKFLIENVFKIQSLNLNDLETQIVLPILWKQYIITQYQKTLTSNQIQKVIDDYIEMLYMASMDESKIDYINGNNTFNFNLFFNQLRDTNDHFEKSYDPYFYKISFLIDNYNYNSIVLNLYNCNERIQRLYNLTIQVEQFLKGKINFTIFHDLLGEPDVCGRLNENCQLYYIPVGENISKVQEMEYQYSLYNDKLDILNKLYQFESKIYYKKVLIDNTDVDIVTVNDIGYYSIKIVESDTSLVFRNIGYLYIGNQQAEYNIYFQENKLYYGETEIGFVDPSIDKFKLFIRKIFLDSIFSSITYLQYIKYDIDYDRIISKEEYNEYEFIRSTDDELIFQLRILKNYKIRKGTLKIYISYTDDDEIILYDNHHGELVFVYPEPNKYIEFITQQYEKLGKMIEKYDKNPEETDNLEYIYQKIYNQITNLNTYLQELLYTTTVYQWEIFDKIRDYLIEQTMNSILLDESTVNSPVRDEEWVTKIIDDNLLSVSQNIQGYIDYDKNELRIDRNLIKYIELDSLDVSLDDVETNLLEAKELEYTDILYSTYNFYDPKMEVHYILNCLLQEYDVYNLYLTLQQKTTRFILNKYILNEINNKTLQELEDINLLTYYRMLVGFSYLTDIQYDAILKTEKNTVFPIVFNKLNQEIFEMNDYTKVIQNLNITFQNFMKLIELSKLKSLSTNVLTDSFSKNRILLSTSNSNIVIKLLDQINTEIKESQFYQQNNYILNEKRDLNINKLSNFKNFTYTNTILSTLKDTNFIEYFIQFNINTFYNMNFFENKSKIINDITKENSLQLLKLEKLEFYVKQASQTFHFEW